MGFAQRRRRHSRRHGQSHAHASNFALTDDELRELDALPRLRISWRAHAHTQAVEVFFWCPHLDLTVSKYFRHNRPQVPVQAPCLPSASGFFTLMRVWHFFVCLCFFSQSKTCPKLNCYTVKTCHEVPSFFRRPFPCRGDWHHGVRLSLGFPSSALPARYGCL